MHKYCKLANDDIDAYLHTPNKTLIYVVHVDPAIPSSTSSKSAYMNFYTQNYDQISMSPTAHRYTELQTDGAVILNDYELFMNKVYHTIMAI